MKLVRPILKKNFLLKSNKLNFQNVKNIIKELSHRHYSNTPHHTM